MYDAIAVPIEFVVNARAMNGETVAGLLNPQMAVVSFDMTAQFARKV